MLAAEVEAPVPAGAVVPVLPEVAEGREDWGRRSVYSTVLEGVSLKHG